MSTPASRRHRNKAARQQNGRCFWCNTPMSGTFPINSRSRTAEHLIPRHQGGPNDRRNIVASCWECNQARGKQDLWGWIDRLAWRLKITDNLLHLEVVLQRLATYGIQRSQPATPSQAPAPEAQKSAPEG